MLSYYLENVFRNTFSPADELFDENRPNANTFSDEDEEEEEAFSA